MGTICLHFFFSMSPLMSTSLLIWKPAISILTVTGFGNVLAWACNQWLHIFPFNFQKYPAFNRSKTKLTVLSPKLPLYANLIRMMVSPSPVHLDKPGTQGLFSISPLLACHMHCISKIRAPEHPLNPSISFYVYCLNIRPSHCGSWARPEQ